MIENGLILAEAYVPPTPEDMHLPPFFTIGDFAFGKQNVLILLSVVIIAVFFLTAARKRAMVLRSGEQPLRFDSVCSAALLLPPR